MNYSDEFIELQKKTAKVIRERHLAIPDPVLREYIAKYVEAIVQEAYMLGQTDALKAVS